MSEYSFTNNEAIYSLMKKAHKDIDQLFAVPWCFVGIEDTDTLGMVRAKMSLEVVPYKTWSHVLVHQPTETEKIEAKLKAWHWVNKYRRRNLACKILDKP